MLHFVCCNVSKWRTRKWCNKTVSARIHSRTNETLYFLYSAPHPHKPSQYPQHPLLQSVTAL